ncbi:MAG TPA: hypothetical protein VH542_12605 [Steroidobacteraceae bacterium]|jgi:hypothetical protein
MTGMLTRTEFTSDARYWRSSSILGADVLEPLHELNRAWLALLAVTPRPWIAHGVAGRLPDPVHCGLLALSAEQRAEVARCPFSLFTAHFSDGAYWTGWAGNREIHERLEREACGGALADFTRLALFFAWHLARTSTSSARIVLGMSDQTIGAFARLPLTNLQHSGDAMMTVMTARWPERPLYWLRLLASVGHQDQLDAVRTLGLQMLAAERAVSEPQIVPRAAR